MLQDYWYCVPKARLSLQFCLKTMKFMKHHVIRMSGQKDTATDCRLLTKLCLLWKYKGPWMFLSCWYWSNLWMELELNGKCCKQTQTVFVNAVLYVHLNAYLQPSNYYNGNTSHYQMMMIMMNNRIQKYKFFWKLTIPRGGNMFTLCHLLFQCWNMWEQYLHPGCKRNLGITCYRF